MNKKVKTGHLSKSQRQLQIGEQIKRIMAEIFLQEGVISIKNGYVTILQADVSPDAKNAKILIDIFGEVDKKLIIKHLVAISPQLRSKLAGKINLRYTPELLFVLNDKAEKLNILDNILKEEAKKFSSNSSSEN